MPGDPAKSLLIKAINYDELEMPPAGKLPAGEIAMLTRWVKEGLPWTAGRLHPRLCLLELTTVRPREETLSFRIDPTSGCLRPVAGRLLHR